MANVLLRSGDIKDFQALGQDGKAIYLFATQIRETLKFKIGAQYTNHLAIPQRNDQGNIIDWYVPFPSNNPSGNYDIIPWSAANDEEKKAALIQLDNFEQKVIMLGEQMANNGNLSGDNLLFYRLIFSPHIHHNNSENIIGIRFPSPEYVYIVNGIPVITFWGFISPQPSMQCSLLQCLKPSMTTTTLSTTTMTPFPIPKTEIVVSRKAWWKRWWFWLLAFLLLLLLLFLLRGCYVKHDTISLATPSTSLANNDLNLPSLTLRESDSHIHSNIDNIALPSVNLNEGNQSVTSPVLALNQSLPDEDIPPSTTDTESDNSTLNPLQTPDPLQTQSLPNNDTQPENNNVTAPFNNSLSLPADSLTEGSTDFLQGKWSVRGGIQDELTGKPLSLQYNFDQGNGTVTVTRSDGVKCIGNVGSVIQQGSLNISSQTQATCSDNSGYQLPKIQCKAGINNVANCLGSYDNGIQFPLTIKQ